MKTRWEHTRGGLILTAPVVSGPVTVPGAAADVVCTVEVPWIEVEILRLELRSAAVLELERRAVRREVNEQEFDHST